MVKILLKISNLWKCLPANSKIYQTKIIEIGDRDKGRIKFINKIIKWNSIENGTQRDYYSLFTRLLLLLADSSASRREG